MAFARLFASVSALVFLVSASCSGPSDRPQPALGSCVLPTNGSNGPSYCRDNQQNYELCITFSTTSTCAALGYDYCCREGSTVWQWSSQADAVRHDEIYGESCASNPVSCTGTSQPNGSGGSSTSSPECTSDSSCSSQHRCKSGKCVLVECTSDAHCGSCERCSSDACVYCGMGPYGCYC